MFGFDLKKKERKKEVKFSFEFQLYCMKANDAQPSNDVEEEDWEKSHIDYDGDHMENDMEETLEDLSQSQSSSSLRVPGNVSSSGASANPASVDDATISIPINTNSEQS